MTIEKDSLSKVVNLIRSADSKVDELNGKVYDLLKKENLLEHDGQIRGALISDLTEIREELDTISIILRLLTRESK